MYNSVLLSVGVLTGDDGGERANRWADAHTHHVKEEKKKSKRLAKAVKKRKLAYGTHCPCRGKCININAV